jgi:3-oxoacyl-[acyl-carrier protein] reductase
MNPRSAFDFAGKTALVTGATGGMGIGIARSLAACGADLVLQSTTATKGDALAEELGANGTRAISVAADLADLAAGERVVDAALAAFGQIDFLVNNAGILNLYPTAEMRVEDWDRTLDINLRGTVFLTLRVVRDMVERRSGSIVNVGSSLSASGGAGPEGVDYNISKAGLQCFTRTLARELAPQGVRVNSISPGIIDTPMVRRPFDDAEVESFLGAIPLGRLGTPDDVAAAVCFALSDAASYITGQALHVNGGARMVD